MFELDGIVPLECCRLVKYDDYHDSLERSFDQEDDTTMGVLLGGVKSSYTFDLLLETKRPDQVFQEYKPGGNNATCVLSSSCSLPLRPYIARQPEDYRVFQHPINRYKCVQEDEATRLIGAHEAPGSKCAGIK